MGFIKDLLRTLSPKKEKETKFPSEHCGFYHPHTDRIPIRRWKDYSIKWKVIKDMKTVGDLMNELQRLKEQIPEFEKFNLCMNVADDDAIYPDLRDVELYINTDIGQVEIEPKIDEEAWSQLHLNNSENCARTPKKS